MSSLVLSDGTRSYDFLAEPLPDIYVQQDGLSLPVVTTENTYAEGSDSEGRTRIRSRATNSEAGSFAVFFKGATDALFWDAVDNLQELVLSAHRNKGTLTYTPPNGVAVTYDLEAINVTDLPQRGVLLAHRHGEATVSFETKPYGRLASRSLALYYSYGQVVNSTAAMLLSLGRTTGLTDQSGNANNGTAQGGVVIGGSTTDPLSVPDLGATDFDGVNDFVSTPALPFTNGQSRTFMGWANRYSTAAIHVLFGGSGTNGPALWINSGGSQTVTFYPDTSGSGTTWAGAWYPGIFQWVHWALVFNETTDAVSLYMNGALVSTQTNTTPYAGSPGTMEIGSRYQSNFWYGAQAWVSMHGSALTATQVRDAYRAGKAIYGLNGPIDSFYVQAVPGQVDAWGSLTIKDDATLARNHVEVGVQHNVNPSSPEPLILYSIVDMSALGGSSNTRSGSISANVTRVALTTSPVAICKAASQPHKGKWKIRVRVYPSAVTARVRLAWRAGDGPFAKEKWVSVPNSGGWYDLDLGTVNIKELPSGHTSEFRIEAFATSGVPTVDVDYIELIPCDNYTKLRGSTAIDTPGAGIVAVDDFSTQTAGAVSGKTPLLAPAGNWSGAGDTDDFSVDATNKWIYRSAVSDSATNNGRYLRCGSGTLAATTVSADVFITDMGVGTDRFGVMLRYTDTSNWLMCYYEYSGLGVYVTLRKRVAGTETTLASNPASGSVGGVWRTLTVGADAAGNVLVYEGPKGGTPVPVILVVADTNLATAGAIASGGYGLYDATTSASVAQRSYDNFSVSTLATSASIVNPAINSGYGTTLTHNTALTASSTSTGTTPIREGKYLKLPPSTRNGEVHRIVVKARPDDADLGLSDNVQLHPLTAELAVTPRVHLTST